MRIRSVKPDFFKDEKVSDQPPMNRLLFIGLWCMADVDGRLEDRPRFIKIEVFPYELADKCDIEQMLKALDHVGLIKRYSVDTKSYIQVINFCKHQRISGKEADTKSQIPPPLGDPELDLGSNWEATGKHPGAQEGKGREGKGRERIFCSDGKEPPEPPPMSEELSKTILTLKRVKLDDPAMLFEVWKAAFPDVGIVKSILACDAWAVSKNVRRSPKGWARTLNTWLSKEQDRAPAKTVQKSDVFQSSKLPMARHVIKRLESL